MGQFGIGQSVTRFEDPRLGLMMAAPLMTAGLRISLTTDPVSRPYLALTAAVMAAFGVEADLESDGVIVVPPAMYTAAAPELVAETML